MNLKGNYASKVFFRRVPKNPRALINLYTIAVILPEEPTS